MGLWGGYIQVYMVSPQKLRYASVDKSTITGATMHLVHRSICTHKAMKKVPLSVCIHIKLHTREHTLLLWCMYVDTCTYTYFTAHPCLVHLKQGLELEEILCSQVQGALKEAALREHRPPQATIASLCLPMMAGLVWGRAARV